MCSKSPWALAFSKIKRLLESIFSSTRFVFYWQDIFDKAIRRDAASLRAREFSLLETSSHSSVFLRWYFQRQSEKSVPSRFEVGFSFPGIAAAYFLRNWWSSR
jgi:hypothetical protein